MEFPQQDRLEPLPLVHVDPMLPGFDLYLNPPTVLSSDIVTSINEDDKFSVSRCHLSLTGVATFEVDWERFMVSPKQNLERE